MLAQFERFEIKMTRRVALRCSHSGDCEADIRANLKNVSRPRKCTKEALKAELAEYGAWENNELNDDEMNWIRIVWLAAGNIKDLACEASAKYKPSL